ncbi:endonuclease [[Mycoplasma] anseris]|uniref:Ribonuclease n=1 Tax=[Mycoplasma] anseris TaxID=92400 RepID=A0A2Z4ND93_9BACT|nr:endonuclease [[Mycoplasma] anseris]AWX69365.1 ribonuclease [[Mycoplasma] anseris]
MKKQKLFLCLSSLSIITLPLISSSCIKKEEQDLLLSTRNNVNIVIKPEAKTKNENSLVENDFIASNYDNNIFEIRYSLIKNSTPAILRIFIKEKQTNREVSKDFELVIKDGNIQIQNKEISNPKPDQKPQPPVAPNKDLVYEKTNKYYLALENLSGMQLLNKLHEIQIEGTRGIKSNSTGYEYLKTTYRDAFIDKYYENDGTILDLYSENPNGKDPYTYAHYGGYSANQEGQGTNREHIIPQSWFNKLDPMRNDAHHVWPSDIYVNEKHGNYPYGTVKTSTFTSLNGTKVGDSFEDGNPVCEPIDAFKGDVARAILYFSFTYKDQNLRNNQSAKRFYIDDTNKINPAFLKTLLKWHHDDPIDQFDIDRNNAIAKHQTVRNPFIDYPELVDVIFNNKTDYTFHNKGTLKAINK